MILGITPRLDQGVDQGLGLVVDPQARGVFRLDDEFVFTGVRSKERALPFGAEILRKSSEF